MRRSVDWFLVVGIAAAVAAVAYRVGYRDGIDDGWWQCVVEMGAVS